MIFTADRKSMYEAARIVSKITVQNGHNPELEGIMLEVEENGKIRMTGTDIVTFIQKRLDGLHVKQTGRLVIRAHIFTEIMRLMPEDTVSFELDRHILSMVSGTARYQIPTLQADKYPNIDLPFPEDTISIVGLSSLIKNTVYATSEQENQVLMQGVKLSFSGGASSATATDGQRMVIAQSNQPAYGELEMVIHKKALQVLCGIINPKDELFVGIAGKSATLFNKELIFSTRLMEGDFVDIHKIIESIDKVYSARLDAQELYKAVSCATAGLQRDDDQCVNMVIESDKMLFSSIASISKASAPVSATDCIPTPTDGFNYKPQLLLDYLQKASGPTELIVDSRGFMLLDANQRKCAVSPRSPVRVRTKEKPVKAKKDKPKKVKSTKTTEEKAAA